MCHSASMSSHPPEICLQSHKVQWNLTQSVNWNYLLQTKSVVFLLMIWLLSTCHRQTKHWLYNTYGLLSFSAMNRADPPYDKVTFLKYMPKRHSLTHSGRVTHICVSKLIIIGSDNGLSPGRRQAIIWTNAGILSIGPLGTNFNKILIEIHTFSFKKMHLNMSSGKRRPFCLGLNVLTHLCMRDMEWLMWGQSLIWILRMSLSSHMRYCVIIDSVIRRYNNSITISMAKCKRDIASVL